MYAQWHVMHEISPTMADLVLHAFVYASEMNPIIDTCERKNLLLKQWLVATKR